MDGVDIALAAMVADGITGVMAEGFIAAAVDTLILPGAVERLVGDVLLADKCSRMGSVVVDGQAVDRRRLMRAAADTRVVHRLMRLRLVVVDMPVVEEVMQRVVAEDMVVAAAAVDMKAVVVGIGRRSKS